MYHTLSRDLRIAVAHWRNFDLESFLYTRIIDSRILPRVGSEELEFGGVRLTSFDLKTPSETLSLSDFLDRFVSDALCRDSGF